MRLQPVRDVTTDRIGAIEIQLPLEGRNRAAATGATGSGEQP